MPTGSISTATLLALANQIDCAMATEEAEEKEWIALGAVEVKEQEGSTFPRALQYSCGNSEKKQFQEANKRVDTLGWDKY